MKRKGDETGQEEKDLMPNEPERAKLGFKVP
jgi:hypothetical protein